MLWEGRKVTTDRRGKRSPSPKPLRELQRLVERTTPLLSRNRLESLQELGMRDLTLKDEFLLTESANFSQRSLEQE